MPAGVLQLVARGNEDMYFIYDPQITFFKKVYKRHTNFSSESMIQNFNTEPDFGKKITCTLSKNADLIHKTYVVVELPKINRFIESSEYPNLNLCAWVKNIGWHIIKKVEISIGSRVIDKHYGDYLAIWSELSRTYNNKKGLDKMIGNVSELTDYTCEKDSYKLTIPLYFWFCNHPGFALPIIALEFTDVQINIDFASINDLLLLAPTHYIDIDEYMVHFKQGDIIYQNSENGLIKNYAKFIAFHNIITSSDSNPINRLFYVKLNDNPYLSYSIDILKDNYKIYSNDDNYCVYPKKNTSEIVHINKLKNFNWTNSLTIKQAYLMVDYIYLDVDERIKFITKNHEYLIDVLLYNTDKVINNNSTKIVLGYSHPCKEIIIRAQMNYLIKNNIMDHDNFLLDYQKTASIIKSLNINTNGTERVSYRHSNYYNYIQSYYHHTNIAIPGVYLYSFALNPESYQPSGSINLSKIDDFQINITVDKNVNYNNQAKIRVYGRCINILRIFDGQAGLAFAN